MLITLGRESLYDSIRRHDGKPLFSFASAVSERLVFTLLDLYRKLSPHTRFGQTLDREALWILVEYMFAPTAFCILARNWQRGLGTEFQGDLCWYLPTTAADGKKLKPVQRVLDSWLRVAGFRTAYGIGKEMDDPDLRGDVDRWLRGEVVPSLLRLHHLVKRFATRVQWLDDPDNWYARFTLGCAMQSLSNAMDDYFAPLVPNPSLALADTFRRIEKERILRDDDKVLSGDQTFFATRLLQLKLQEDGKWESQVLRHIQKQKPRKFRFRASGEEAEKARREFEWKTNPGNLLIELLKKQPASRPRISLEDHILNLA